MFVSGEKNVDNSHQDSSIIVNKLQIIRCNVIYTILDMFCKSFLLLLR